jgi:hypothetical protein
MFIAGEGLLREESEKTHDMDATSQPFATAALQTAEPR